MLKQKKHIIWWTMQRNKHVTVFTNIFYYFKCNQNDSSYRNYRQL